MNNKNKSLIKNIGLFTIGSFGSKILTFLLVPLYTTVLSTAEYGAVDLTTSTSSLLAPIFLLGIFDATLRFGMDSDYKKEDVISTSINIANKGLLILLLCLSFISITHVINVQNSYLIFLGLYCTINAYGQIFNLYLRAKNQASVIAVSGILCTLITCLSNILFLLVFKFGILGYMISNIIGILVQNLYQLFVGKIYKDIRIQSYHNLSKPMVKYSVPLIANSISLWINNASDRYILTFIKGVAVNGIYSVSYKIPTILFMFQNIFYNAWSISAIAEFDENDSDGFIGNNYLIYSLISLLVCSGLLIINIPLATFLYKGNYFIAWRCVPFLLAAMVFNGISQFEGSLFSATRNTKLVAKTTVIGAIVNTTCNFIFIYFWGAVGAAFATLLGYLTTWFLRTKYLQNFIKMKVNWHRHFISIILVLIQTVMATVGVSPTLHLIFFMLLVLVNKDYLILIVKKIKH